MCFAADCDGLKAKVGAVEKLTASAVHYGMLGSKGTGINR